MSGTRAAWAAPGLTALLITMGAALAAQVAGEVEADAALTARYIAESITASGRMRYRVRPDDPDRADGRYNVLRHAGAVLSLATFLEHRRDAEARAALLRAARYLVSCCIAPVPGHDDLLAVWSRSAITGVDRPDVAKLGGAGLALAGLSRVERIAPGTTEPGVLRALARFVLRMQKPDGSFYSRYVPSDGGPRDDWTSLYYPGEAALGLLDLYDLDPSREWIERAARALRHLARSRRGDRTPPPDHWALIATERLARIARDAPGLVDAPLLRDHAGRIARAMLHEQELAMPACPGAFTADGRTTPTAIRVEGLLAAHRVLAADDPALGRRIRLAVDAAVAFLRRAIIRAGPLAGGVPRAIAALPEDGTEARSRFNRRAGEIRIDYVQHVSSALQGYGRVLRDADARRR